MKAIIATYILIVGFGSIGLQAGEIQGQVTLKTKDGIVSRSGQVFVGDLKYMPAVSFPPFLKAEAEATLSGRISKIDEDGKFVLTGVPENKTLIVGISLHGIDYFIVVTLGEGEVLNLTREIDMTISKSDVLVSIDGESSRAQHKDFGQSSYLFQSGKEGWMVSGVKGKDSTIKFNSVGFGEYNLVVLSAPNATGPNVVDQKPIVVDGRLSAPISLIIKD